MALGRLCIFMSTVELFCSLCSLTRLILAWCGGTELCMIIMEQGQAFSVWRRGARVVSWRAGYFVCSPSVDFASRK